MIEQLHRGESLLRYVTFTEPETDQLGNVVDTPIPHAEINAVRIVLHNSGKVLHRFSTLQTDINEGWDELTTEQDEGTYSFHLTPAQTMELPLGPLLITVSRIFDKDHVNDFTELTTQPLRMVCSSILEP